MCVELSFVRLTYLYTHCSHSTKKDRGPGHLVHSTVSKHISLAAGGRNTKGGENELEEGEVKAPDSVKVHLPVQGVVDLHQI